MRRDAALIEHKLEQGAQDVIAAQLHHEWHVSKSVFVVGLQPNTDFIGCHKQTLVPHACCCPGYSRTRSV